MTCAYSKRGEVVDIVKTAGSIILIALGIWALSMILLVLTRAFTLRFLL